LAHEITGKEWTDLNRGTGGVDQPFPWVSMLILGHLRKPMGTRVAPLGENPLLSMEIIGLQKPLFSQADRREPPDAQAPQGTCTPQ